MVQRRGTEHGLDSSNDGDVSMPTYLHRAGHRYIFRQAVPDALRAIIGKREFKKSLGIDYREAVRKGKLFAVEVEQQFASARAKLARAGERVERMKVPLKVITEVTPALMAQFRSRWLSIVDAADWQRRADGFDELEQGEVTENHAGMVPLLRQALATGYVSPLIAPMHQTLYLMGFQLADHFYESSEERRLTLEMARCALEGIKIVSARDLGEDPPVLLPAEPLVYPTEPVPSAPDGWLLSRLIAQFLSDWVGRKPMLKKLKLVLGLFLELIGDRPIGSLRQSHLNEFFVLVQRLPPRWPDECRRRKMTVSELVKLEHSKTLGPTTLEDGYVAAIRVFLGNAVRDYQDQGFPTTLTAKGVRYAGTRKAGEYKQRAFKPDELKRLFEGSEFKAIAGDIESLHMFWLPVIGLYTGARINEICQINPLVDVVLRDGVLSLAFTVETEAGEGVEKSIKTKVNRFVPVHRHMLDLGFAEYVDALKLRRATRIFPAWPTLDGRASPAAGKWFTRFLGQLGIHGVMNEGGNAVRGSHAFRFTVLTYGKLAKLNLRCITGHAEPDTNLTAQGYEDETLLLPITLKQTLLDALDYALVIPRPVALK